MIHLLNFKREEPHQNPHDIFVSFPQTLGYYAAAQQTTAPLAPHRTAGGRPRTYAASGSQAVCPASTASAAVSVTPATYDIVARDTQRQPGACSAPAALSLRLRTGLPGTPARPASPQSPRGRPLLLPPSLPASIRRSNSSNPYLSPYGYHVKQFLGRVFIE
jgi:hypothetical protein